MAFDNILATLVMTDSRKRLYRKEIETGSNVLATSQGQIDAFLLVLQTITDLGVLSVKYSYADGSQAFAAVSPSNRDVGATFVGVNQVGRNVVWKLPGIKDTYIGVEGAIDVANVDIAAVLTYFETGESFSLSDGDTVEQWLRGSLDK